MGREERVMNAMREAEWERTIGPLRGFEEIVGCPKCGLDAPENASTPFVKAWCQGKSISSRERECPIEGEHLHAMCPRCKWGFVEHTKDHQKVTLA